MKSTRRDVYEALDSEPGCRGGSVGDYLTAIRVALAEADEAWVGGDWDALQDVRKIGALAVQCMENHGAPIRTGGG